MWVGLIQLVEGLKGNNRFPKEILLPNYKIEIVGFCPAGLPHGFLTCQPPQLCEYKSVFLSIHFLLVCFLENLTDTIACAEVGLKDT